MDVAQDGQSLTDVRVIEKDMETVPEKSGMPNTQLMYWRSEHWPTKHKQTIPLLGAVTSFQSIG